MMNSDVKKKVSIFGSTGSVGTQTVDLIKSRPDDFDVRVLTCQKNIELLAEQARQLDAETVVVEDESLIGALKSSLSDRPEINVLAGKEGLVEAAAIPVDWTMASIVGMAGLPPLIRSLEHGTAVAIANKEPLVAAGPLVMARARKYGTTLLPVDSEHNAIFQIFDSARPETIEEIVLTASGGPFRTWSREEMDKASVAQAVAHPTWSMGRKISVDSATMMNKALEVIEAHFLFDMPPEKIGVLVHPQSLVHGLVKYCDGSALCHVSSADMRTPIASALAFPKRMKTTGQSIDLKELVSLEFSPLDGERFPAVTLAKTCIHEGQWACIAFNAANEVAVEYFLNEKISFLQIVETVKTVVNSARDNGAPDSFDDFEAIFSWDRLVREMTKDYIFNAGSSRNVA